MISVTEAVEIISRYNIKLEIEVVNISQSNARVLAETINAERDYPPFDRVAMDGIAICYDQTDIRALVISKGICPAGAPQKSLVESQACFEVMTGAILPERTDTVIKYEDLSSSDAGFIINENVTKGQNVHEQGSDYPAQKTLLDPGLLIKAEHIAILASEGYSEVKVYKWPTIAVISTGDELVEIGNKPQSHQIRRSNVFMIIAALKALGIEADNYHLNDDKLVLEKTFEKLESQYDILIMSGGVSKGKYDFIPEVLENLGVTKHFHRVKQKPGKPFWFGTSKSSIFFAFPGNPVSTFVCYQKYFKPWLLSQFGINDAPLVAKLSHDINFPPPLNFFAQVKTSKKEGVLMAEEVKGNGSGDFINLKNVDGFLELPSHKNHFKKGELYTFIPFD